MCMLYKKEYQALLAPGFHSMTLTDIKNVCVDSFKKNDRRKEIYDKFLDFIGVLSDIPVCFEIWIDGSFTTQKDEPEDIDIVVFAHPDDINNLDNENMKKLEYLLIDKEITKARFLTDAYFVPLDNMVLRSYWRGWYGFTRNEEPKGIITLEIKP